MFRKEKVWSKGLEQSTSRTMQNNFWNSKKTDGGLNLYCKILEKCETPQSRKFRILNESEGRGHLHAGG